MSQKLISLRVELSKRLADAQVVGRSRELSLAVTSIQSARMLFGSVALLLGSTNPYPQADKPMSAVIHPSADLAVDYVPVAVVDQLSSVKFLRVFLQVHIDEAVALRSELWARPYASSISITPEVLFDRALTELFLAKQWLGEQLAVIAGHALVTPPMSGGFAMVMPTSAEVATRLIEKVEAKDLAIIAGILVDKLALFMKAPEGGAASDSGAVALPHLGMPAPVVVSASPAAEAEAPALEGLSDAVSGDATAEAVEAAKQAVDDKIRVHLAAGKSVTEVCRALDVTEYRVNKIKKALPAAAAETPAN